MQRPIKGLVLLLGGLTFNSWTVVAAEPGAGSLPAADPTLTRFVQSVVNTNPSVQAARAALEASTAFKDAAARPLYNPVLSLDAENADSDTRSVGISQTIDWGGKRSARTSVFESERLAMEAEYLSVRRAITSELLSGLSSHQTGTERDALAAERVRLMNEFAKLARRRFEAGDLNQVELDLATLVATDARMQKAMAATNLAEARQAIRSLSVSSVPAQWPTLPVQLPVLPSSASDPQSLVLALPEVRAAQRRVDAASAAVEFQKLQRRPDPTVSLTGGKEEGVTLIGLNLTVPLFIRNRFIHEVTAAVAEYSEAQQIADDILRRAYARLIGAAERYQLSQGAWRDWGLSGQVSVNRRAELLRQLWVAGEISTTEFLVQLRQTLDVQESALDLRQALWRAWFEWLTASGQIDQWLSMETSP